MAGGFTLFVAFLLMTVENVRMEYGDVRPIRRSFHPGHGEDALCGDQLSPVFLSLAANGKTNERRPI